MKNLRLFDLDWKCTSCQPTFLPDKLRWLCWREYPFSSLPIRHMRKLVGLDMFGGLVEHVWEGQKILPNLKFVDLSKAHALTRFPDVSGALNIERLILSNCRCLVEVHQSLGSHRRLVYLDMSDCRLFKCLPSRIEMESLETLILSNCFSLERFPEVSPSMVKLSNIHLDHCVQIEELPSSIRYLSGLSFLNLISCENLKNIPNSICELKHLKSLRLHKCKKLQKLPEELGSMENLEELLLGLSGIWDFEKEPESISFHTLTSLCSLRKLDLSWIQIEEKDFPQNLHAFSSLEELHLSGNRKLTQLPAGISHLSRLKILELNKCCRLQNLHALPSGIQLLKAIGCSSLEKIGDLTKEYEWLYKIWLFDCHKLLADQENERYLDKMLQLSFFKKCAAVNHRLSISIPGSNVPSWFKEKRNGCSIALKLPPKCHTQIMGFAVCGVFHGGWRSECAPRIIFRIVNDEKAILNGNWHSQYSSGRIYIPWGCDEKAIPKSQVDSDNGNTWISYIPFGFFQQMYQDFRPEDWSHIEGNLVMALKRTHGYEPVRCGAHIVYKEDVESIQQNRTCISDYGNLVQVDGDDYQEDLDYDRRVSGNTYMYEEKSDDQYSGLMPPRTRMSSRHILYRTFICELHGSPWICK